MSTNETLVAVLSAMGFEEAATMSEQEVISLARTLGVEVPSSLHDETESGETNVAAGGMDTTVSEPNEDLDTAFVADSSIDVTQADDTGANNSTAEAPAENDSSHDDTISAFCSITGAEPSAAQHLLEAFGWDLDGAVSMYLEGNTGSGGVIGAGTPPASRAPIHTHFDAEDRVVGGMMSGIGNPDNDVVMPPMPGMEHMNSVLQSMMRQSMGMNTDDDGPLPAGFSMPQMMASFERSQRQMQQQRRGDVYDEDGVRLPDPVHRERLVSGGFSPRWRTEQEEFGRADDPSVEWMFPPPRHLSSQLPLEQARAEAQQEGRWLLANIQTHEEFSSHMLNRDTWKDETIESILRTTYLLWQRGHTTGDGKAYMRLHHLTEEDLPHIGIIDPRTGAKLLTLTGFITPEDLTARLMEFQERHAAPVLSRPTSQAPSNAPNSAAPSATGSGTPSNASSGHTSSSNLAGLDTTAATGATGAGGAGAGAGGTGRSRAGIAALEAESGKGGAGFLAQDQTQGAQSGQKYTADYGSVPDEPAEGDENAVKVSIKLSDGKAFARRYHKSDKVEVLFAVAATHDAAGQAQPFDLVTRFPTLSLLPCRDQILGDHPSLAGSQVIMKML